MKTKIVIFLLAFVVGTLQSAQIAYEPFDGIAGTDINGTTGGTGWGGAWIGNTSWDFASPGLTFPGLETSGLKSTMGDQDTGITRALPAPVTVGLGVGKKKELWVSALGHFFAVNGIRAGYSMRITLYNGTTLVGYFGKAVNQSIVFDVAGSGIKNVSGSLGSGAGTTGDWFFVLHLKANGSNTDIALYVAEDSEVFDIHDPTSFAHQATATVSGSITFGSVGMYRHNDFESFFDEIMVADTYSGIVASDVATDPIPENGSIAPVETDLSWAAPGTYTPTGFDVWFGTEPNELNPNYNMLKILDKQSVTSVDPSPSGDLPNSTKYYWRVDAYEPNAPGPDILRTGELWSFTTVPPTVILIGSPESLTLSTGQEAVFTVTATNVETYKWFKNGSQVFNGENISGADTASLAITNVQQSDEGLYYCIVANSVPSSIQSSSAALLTKRLVARWAFDGNLNDSLGVWNGDLVDPNTANPNPADSLSTYVAGAGGAAGSAIRFESNKYYVEIPGSASYFNFHPRGLTVTAWVRDPAPNDGTADMRVVSKQNNYEILNQNDSRVQCALTGFTTRTPISAAVGQDTQWHLVAMTFDPAINTFATSAVYTASGYLVDGWYTGSAVSTPITTVDDATILSIGALASTRASNLILGEVDDVRIYSYPLSQTELLQLFVDMTGKPVCKDPAILRDYNRDCKVTIDDFADFATHWLDNQLF